MKNVYKEMILEAVDECHDIDLLDLVWKILIKAEGAPSPDNTTQEVKYEDNTRTVRVVPLYADRTGEAVRHPAPNGARLAWRKKKPAGVCDQYDAGNIAA